MAFKAWHIPVRLVTGAYILNSGLQKRGADEETAKALHGFATTAYPEFEDTPPEKFVQMLSTGEIAVGALLLTPIVPTPVAGLALTTFSGLLARLYMNTPGLREEGDLRPTEQGIPIAKDAWLMGIGAALTMDGLSDRKRKRRKTKAKAKAAEAEVAEELSAAKDAAKAAAKSAKGKAKEKAAKAA